MVVVGALSLSHGPQINRCGLIVWTHPDPCVTMQLQHIYCTSCCINGGVCARWCDKHSQEAVRLLWRWNTAEIYSHLEYMWRLWSRQRTRGRRVKPQSLRTLVHSWRGRHVDSTLKTTTYKRWISIKPTCINEFLSKNVFLQIALFKLLCEK